MLVLGDDLLLSSQTLPIVAGGVSQEPPHPHILGISSWTMVKPPTSDLPLMSADEGIVLFYPHVPRKAKEYVCDTLDSRWIGQGPKVEQFEPAFRAKFKLPGPCVGVGSGTDALHLSYLLAGIEAGDEVLTPVFTCAATNIPLLYIGAKIRFVDVDPISMNISIADLRSKISERTKAIVCVHYGGLPCDMDAIGALASEYSIPVIEDAAQALGATYGGVPIGAISDFTIFSFQAIKHLTTGNGGIVTFRDAGLEQKARRLRWFGIDRVLKQKGIWENDITEVGYKYEMTDIEAAIGLAGLEEFDDVLAYRRSLYQQYVERLRGVSHVRIVNDFNPAKRHAAWLFTISVERRMQCQLKLRSRRIESGQVHFRNDRYSIFGCTDAFPGMDAIDDNYLVLPVHTKMSLADVDTICDVLREGW
jgi:perosamine synthetase